MSGLEDFALQFTLAAAHVVWIGALVGLVAFGIEKLPMKSAAARHAVHLIGLLVILAALPTALVMGSAGSQPRLPTKLGPGSSSSVVSLKAERSESITSETPRNVPPLLDPGMSSAVVQTGSVAPTPVTVGKTADVWTPLAPWIAGSYGFGLLAMILRLCFGVAGSIRLRAQSETMAQGEWIATMRRMANAMNLRVQPALQWSREVTSPVVMGLLKPAILLPVALMSRLTPAQVEAVLAHELAHLCRRDTWAVAVQRLAETVLFFHPAVWWMSRCLETAREQACDDLVVIAGCDPADYAEALLVCSEWRLEQVSLADQWAPHLAATGRDGAPLRQRILRLLGQGEGDSVRVGRIGWLLAVLGVGGVVLVVTANRGKRESLADFDFDDPPMGYEKGIEVADRHQIHQVEGLRFAAAPLLWKREGWRREDDANTNGQVKALFLNLGVASGYDIVEFRLFDHESRQLLHDSAWQRVSETEAKFAMERIGSSPWVTMKETGGTFPRKIDVWLRLVINGAGKPLILAPENGASVRRGGSEIIIESIFRGIMDGDGQSPSGIMRWKPETVREEDRRFTVDFENRGSVLPGRYHLVAVLKDGTRRVMDDLHFRSFRNRHQYVRMDAGLDSVARLELIPFQGRHKFFFNGLVVPHAGLPKLSRSMSDRINAWVAEVSRGELSEEDFVLRLKQAGPQTVRGLIPLMHSGKTDRLAMKGAGAFLDDANVVDHLAKVLKDLSEQADQLSPNTRHCCLLLLGKSKAPRHIDLAASFLDSAPIAAMYALEAIGGSAARDHLIGAFDQIPTDKWWLLAEHLRRLGDSGAIPELRRRLAMVEIPPTSAFPRRSVGAFTESIRALSGIEESLTWHSWQQGQHFIYPFNGPGSAKTFSVNPRTDHYVKLPSVNPDEASGRKAIWDALELGTSGPGFTLDGDELVLFHGLKATPLWEDGPPYPTTLHDWIDQTSHAALLESVRKDAPSDRMAVPQNGLLLAKDPHDRLYVLKLEKRHADFGYSVGVRALDPLRQLVKRPVTKNAFTIWSACTLHDLDSGTRNGAFNMSRNRLLTMDEARWREPAAHAVLVAEFAANAVALGVAGAEEFVLAEASRKIDAEDLVSLLKNARAKEAMIDGHEVLNQSGAIFHRFADQKPEECFGFAVRMPSGVPVAGLLEIRQVNHLPKTVDIRYRFLRNEHSRQVFAVNEGANSHKIESDAHKTH